MARQCLLNDLHSHPRIPQLSLCASAIFVGLAVSGGCRGASVTSTAPVLAQSTFPEKIPAGRFAEPLRCDNGRPPERTRASCFVPNEVGVRRTGGIQIDNGRYDPRPPPLPGEPPCNSVSMYLCGVHVTGGYGSYALTCRDAQDQPTGIARLMAPDSSVLAEGVCEHGRGIGTWLGWRFGRLVGAFSIVDSQVYGLKLYWNDGAYHTRAEPRMTGGAK
jgi:hypothetical protein